MKLLHLDLTALFLLISLVSAAPAIPPNILWTDPDALANSPGYPDELPCGPGAGHLCMKRDAQPQLVVPKVADSAAVIPFVRTKPAQIPTPKKTTTPPPVMTGKPVTHAAT